MAFAAGVFCLQQQAALPASAPLFAVALAASCAAFAGAVVLLQRGRLRAQQSLWLRAALLAGAALIGFSWAGWRAAERLADALPAALEGRDIAVVGLVASLPQRFERGERFEFLVESAALPAAEASPGVAVKLPQRLLLTWYHAWDEEGSDETPATDGSAIASNLPPLHPGERWRVTLRLKRPHGNANAHGFDYEGWLFERDLRATGYVRSRPPPQRLVAFVGNAETLIERARDLIRERFLAALPEAPYAGVLMALAIGDQRAIPNSQWRTFNRTGVTHLMSISGLHVTMVAALCAALVNQLWRRSERLMLRQPAQRAAIAAGWLTALLYSLLAGFAVPAQRTLYMLSVLALALWSGRHFGAARTLLLALLVVLLLDPWAVLAAGFWLSFGAVGVLLYIGAPRIGAVSGWRERIMHWGLTQWAVTVGSVPLLLLLFQQFSLVSPLANALAIPVVSFVITPLALIFAVLPWPPLIAIDHELLALLMRWLEALSDWPQWQQPAPPLPAVLLAVLGVGCLLLPRGFPARWLGAVLLLPALLTPPPRPPVGEVWLDVLDVGHGLAVVVRTRTHALLYDTGPRYGADADAGQRVVVPFLRAAGVERLDTLVVSHRDNDHAGGTESVLGAVPVARVLSSVAGLAGERCLAGQAWDWDGVRFRVLHPLAAAYATPTASNHLSCVLRIESAGGRSALLVGDIETPDEAALLARAAAATAAAGPRTASPLKSDVLVAPHHGSRTSSSLPFVAAVAPSEVVFTVGYRDRFGHPVPEVAARYAAARQWRSDRDGELSFVLADAVSAAAWRQQYRRYWHWREQ
ncbi:DNA internalization-related competence protein ComEC/Rec2 [Rhodocyclus tenuis]|uniref:DNA internalization-related competence protein ComEC/Rec2 n=1 Tax=Rhodocyclus tenuis TaxID=1066 RepID=UPI0030B8E37C